MSVTFFPGTGEHDDRPDLNVHNSGAAALLNVLGFIPEGTQADDVMWGGDAEAADFAARVATAQALLHVTDDAQGVPATRQGRWYDGGRDPGYLAERLEILAKVAHWAAEHGAKVHWG